MHAIFAALRFIFNRVPLVFVFIAYPCHAVCTVTNPVNATLGSATLSASGAVRPMVGSTKYQYTFSVKCSAASNYHLSVGNIGAPQSLAFLTMVNPNGDEMTATVTLKSVAGVAINTGFNSFPNGAYSGAIAAGQSQTVVVEFMPVAIKPKGGRASGGYYNANGTITLSY